MDLFSGYFWVFLSNLTHTVFRFFTRIFTRYYKTEATNKACSSTLSPESHQIGTNFSDLEDESINTDNVVLEERETPQLVFKFQYQTWNYTEEFNAGYTESYDFDKTDTASESATKYEFNSVKSFSHLMEEPEVSNLTVKELYFLSNDGPLENEDINISGFLSERDFMPESFTEGVKKVEMEEKLKAAPSAEQRDCGKDRMESPNNSMVAEEISTADNFLSEDDFIGSSSESNSVSSNFDSLFEDQLEGLAGDKFFSDTDFGTTIENHDEENAGLTEEDLDLEEEKNSENLDVGYEPDDFDEEDRDIMEELRKLEQECQLQNSNTVDMEKMSLSGNSSHLCLNSKPENFGDQEKRPIDCSEESAKPNSQNSTILDLEDSNRFGTLWEHLDLVEQLKMEVKKVRATGLPTILEDSESPRTMEDLKPWKIDEKSQHGSTINELPKFYWSYRERMRKFDILNYQKMYAIGLLRSKDPLQSFSRCKTSASAMASLFFSHNFGLCRLEKAEMNPVKKLIREVYSELEVVYVGQLCLSWELLQWEYGKALELWESDHYGLPRYNEVAGEFQQFQVLLQRFIENEPFQGPRVETYLRHRCVMRNLLQVPLVREDKAKDKRKVRKRGRDSDGMSSDVLVEMLEESIRTMWRFIRADKHASSFTPKGVKGTQAQLQQPADSELLHEVRADLQKKEKRVREQLRSRSCCIWKKLQMLEGDGRNHVLYFFSQVDMKLVWRVLRMRKITKDQLAWCRNKLNNISFVKGGRIHIEPSFLLFPCS